MVVRMAKKVEVVCGDVVVPKSLATILVNPRDWPIFGVIEVKFRTSHGEYRYVLPRIFPFQIFVRVVHSRAS